jgi:hypothetical protein
MSVTTTTTTTVTSRHDMSPFHTASTFGAADDTIHDNMGCRSRPAAFEEVDTNPMRGYPHPTSPRGGHSYDYDAAASLVGFPILSLEW